MWTGTLLLFIAVALSLFAPQLSHRRRVAASPPAAAGGSSRLQQVLDGIDDLNRQDPRTVSWQGQQLPYELAYSQWLTDWVQQLEPHPSEELRIVARGQHVERWKSPRSSFPEVCEASCGLPGLGAWRERVWQGWL